MESYRQQDGGRLRPAPVGRRPGYRAEYRAGNGVKPVTVCTGLDGAEYCGGVEVQRLERWI